MKKISFIKLFAAFVFIGIAFGACKKEKENAEELITKVELHDHAANVEYAWEDPEGNGNPTVDTVRLQVGQKVEFEIHFYDGAEEITSEVRSEDVEHLVVYVSPSGSLQISTLDTDANGKPLGLQSEWNPTAPASTTVQIRLKHQPDKNAADPGSTGDTDVDVSFPVVITQ